MRLLNSRSKRLELLLHGPARYAIVSHRWGPESEEVLFDDIGDLTRTQSKTKGYRKIVGACDQAVRDGLDYVWLDTCCIDKANHTELIEAINAMYQWYQKSDVCYAYLHDVANGAEFARSEWFSRGWTLQELIAPRVLKFFTRDWRFIGTREELINSIVERTGISPGVLRSDKIPSDVSISQRMFWAAKRETTRAEDRAYSMLGILGVSMHPVYGIDSGAFEDLQHKIIDKYSDQTLFAWYCTVPPQDAETADADSISTPPDPMPDVASDIVENEDGAPSPNATGLFASSPSQYLISYEIPENEFRTHYIDGIRDYSYRSHFSISNNLVHISLPIKHVAGKVWKAVLRCSFEPPGGDKPQRPLVVYLEQISPVKYYRVHLAPDEDPESFDEKTDDVPVVGLGSLERLSDGELKLEGYVLRDIDVVAWHHDTSAPKERLRPLPADPDAPTTLSEADRIATFLRHPPGTKTTNVIICGEPGVAAGRVINLITGKTIIEPLTDYDREPMAVTLIDATLASKNVRIFYVIGPRDQYLDADAYYVVLRNMRTLAQAAHDAGGIHLVMLCMVGSRVTAPVETNYRLFFDGVCQKEVPMMLIVTGLGKTKRMEDWWDKHADDPELKAMRFCAHACITVLQGEDQDHEHKKKYEESVKAVQRLLVEFMEGTPKAFSPGDVDQWFVHMGRRAMDCVRLKKAVKQESIAKSLKEGNLGDVDASRLARLILDEHAMEH